MRTRMFLAVAIVLFFAACATGVKYSPQELSSYPKDIQEHIKNGEIVLGMTMQQVRFAWGSPQLVRTLTTKEGRLEEEWVYSNILGLSKTCLYFEGDRLTQIIAGNPSDIKQK